MDDKYLKCLSLLGLSSDATHNDIEVAYKHLSQDIQKGSLSREKSKEIFWAYDYLKNCVSETVEKNINEEKTVNLNRSEKQIGYQKPVLINWTVT